MEQNGGLDLFRLPVSFPFALAPHKTHLSIIAGGLCHVVDYVRVRMPLSAPSFV